MNIETKKLMAMPLLAGITYALIWLAIGALTLSLLLHFTSMRESNLVTLTFIVHGLSAWIGGLSAGKRSQAKGWYYGSSLGLLYGILIIMISFLATDVSLSLHSFLLLSTIIASGALGGIIGVNLRK